MAFDPLVANAGRLKILAALAVEGRQPFVQLRDATRLTDGNLACHTRRLRAGGLIEIDKQVADGKPITHLTLTPDGRRALEAHVRKLMAALSQRRVPAPDVPNVPAQPPRDEPRPSRVVQTVREATVEEDWVD